MALIAESKTANIVKSLNAYFYASLITAAGLQVHFPDRPGLFIPTSARWVRLDYLLGMRRDWMGTVAGSNKGNLVEGIVNINCCELIAKRTDAYALYALRDSVHAYVQEGSSITVKDYDTVGNPIVGYLSVVAVSEADIQDGMGEGENGISIKNLSATLAYIEAFS